MDIEHNGPIPRGMQIHHLDGDKLNNNIDNLWLMSIEEHTRLHNNGFQKGNKEYMKRKHNVGNTHKDEITGRFIKNVI